MEQAIRWLSPKSSSGSIFFAALAHAALYGIIVLCLSLGMLRFKTEEASKPEEVAYETFDVPPAPASVAKPIARTPEPETPKEANMKPDTSPKELQDQKGDVTGAQTLAKQQATTGATGQGDALATPYYKIKPKYPRAALVAGVEGWILMKVDVNEKGEVENVRIVGGEQRSMFQDEARRAVEKWKYKPFVNASGQPMRKTDHEVRVDFKLQDA